MQNRKKTKGNVLITIGLLLLAAALALFGYNRWDSERAGKASQRVVDAIDHYEKEEADSSSSNPEAEPTPEPAAGSTDPLAGLENTPMPTLTVDGHDYIGEIEIPSINRKLPVMADWSMADLKTSPCRYSGSYYNDDMVILGHNYLRHFSLIKWLDIGADIYFTNVNGLRIHYTVSNRETINPTNVDQMIENSKNSDGTADWDLTLFTCTTGGQARCAVRCIRDKS